MLRVPHRLLKLGDKKRYNKLGPLSFNNDFCLLVIGCSKPRRKNYSPVFSEVELLLKLGLGGSGGGIRAAKTLSLDVFDCLSESFDEASAKSELN